MENLGIDRQSMLREHPEWFQQCTRCQKWFLKNEPACPECHPSKKSTTGITWEQAPMAILGFLFVGGLFAILAYLIWPTSPEEEARRAKAESVRNAQIAAQQEAEQRAEELSYCVGLADQVDQMYLVYQASRDYQGLHNALDRSALAAHYNPYQWKTANDSIDFVVRLPSDLPGMEAGKRWIKEKCK